MLNNNDVSDYLKISPTGLEVSNGFIYLFNDKNNSFVIRICYSGTSVKGLHCDEHRRGISVESL